MDHQARQDARRATDALHPVVMSQMMVTCLLRVGVIQGIDSAGVADLEALATCVMIE